MNEESKTIQGTSRGQKSGGSPTPKTQRGPVGQGQGEGQVESLESPEDIVASVFGDEKDAKVFAAAEAIGKGYARILRHNTRRRRWVLAAAKSRAYSGGDDKPN